MRSGSLLFAACLLTCTVVPVSAIELLTNGNLEAAGGGPLGWTLSEYPTTGTGNFDTASQVGFADRGTDPGELGLWLKPWAGGSAPPGRLVNAVLQQSVPATPGVGYSFAGWSRWEENYSGGVTTLAPTSPLGAVPSPTRTEMELAFLNSSGTVIGSPFVLDLRTQQGNFDNWVQHDFDATFGGGSPLIAPAGTARVRVTAAMYDGIFNTNPRQSAFFDDFTLYASTNPGVDILVNGDLNIGPPEFPGFDVVEFPDGVDTVNAQNAPWAQNPNTPGVYGAFLHPWANGGLVSNPNDAILSQTVPGMAGGNYTYRLWTKFEGNYSGGIDTLSPASPNGAVPSPTQTLMSLSFLDLNQNVIGSPITLNLRTDREAQSGGNANDNQWWQHTINGTAPVGTQFVRVSASMLDGVFNTDPQQSAFFDDFSLMLASVPGDFNNDGQYNCLDIDALTAAIAGGSNPASFDLTGDGLVNLADRDQWLSNAGGVNLGPGRSYLLGDATLDGYVDGSDFGRWNANKGTNVAAWCSGDFNATGSVNNADFAIWFANRFQSSFTAVPEPATWGALLVGVLAWLSSRRARDRSR